MFRTMRFALATVLAAALLISLTGAAFAAEPHPLKGRRALHGTITEINDGSLTVDTAGGAVNVTIDENTKLLILGRSNATLADLQPGDVVLARGPRLADGSVQAHLVALRPEGEKRWGRVRAVDDGTLTLLDPAGQELTIHTSADTLLAAPGAGNGADGAPLELDQLAPGTPLIAFGQLTGETTMEAHTLLLLHLPRRRVALAGTITQTGDDGFTLQTPRGFLVTVEVDESTPIRSRQEGALSLAGLSSGDQVAVVGRLAGPQTVQAQAVVRAPEEGFHGFPVIGKITAIGQDTIELATRRGPRTLALSAETQLHIPGEQDVTLADFNLGDLVLAKVQRNPEHDVPLVTHLVKRDR